MHPDTIDINIDLPGGCMPASHEAASGGPLDGIRVLDLSSVVMGPLATQILGDLGADVITVETRDGDINRIMGSGPCPGLSGVSLNLLRNKRNISLDIAHPDGRAALLRVAAGCDVFVTNLRPGSVGRLRLRYPDIASIRPDVIYCQAHGFPSDSPQADAPAFDDIIQAACGVPDVLRRASGRPGLMPTLLADKVSGLVLAYSIIAALFLREFLTPPGSPTADSVPWGHLDVAGPARADSDEDDVTKGATGFGVRTLLRWLEAGAPA